MREEIFIFYKKEENEYYGKCLTDKTIKYITNVSNIQFNKKYFLRGEAISEDTFKASQVFEYTEFIGTIIDLKPQKNKRNIATILTEDGVKLKADVNSIYTELNEVHMFKGYYESKTIITTFFAKKLTEIEVEAKEELKKFANNYKNYIKAEIIDKSSMGAKREKIFLIGNFSLIYSKDILKVYGYKDGNKFYVLSYTRDVASSTDMLKNFLCKVFAGIWKSPRTYVNKLVVKYGIDVLDKIENYSEDLLIDFKWIDEELYKKMYDRLLGSKQIQEFFYFCEKNGISADVADFIFKQYGGGALNKLKINPYVLTEAKLNLFEEADIIAKELNWEFSNLERTKSAIKYFISQESISKGDMYVEYEDILNELTPFVLKYGVYEEGFIEKEIVETALEELLAEEIIKIEKNKVYYLYNYVYEKESARMLKNLIEDFKPPFCKTNEITKAIENFNKTNSTKLASKQESAIIQALTNNISILTGGPGTGKTLTVNAILKTILEIKPTSKIKLAAPTGRAAKRMNEVTKHEATTIHKLLGLTAFDTLTKDSEPPKALENLDFLIIDEFSMIDSKLFYEILLFLDDKTRVIIIGDSNQLPPVGAGQTLKDLISSGLIKTTELTEIFRQAEESNIIQISHKMIKKQPIDIDNYRITDIKDILEKDVSYIESYSLQTTLEKTYETLDILLENSYKFDDIQILSPMNKGELGTTLINNEIQKLYNDKSNEKDKYEVTPMLTFNKDDKVIQTVNNYDIGVMNGSIGYIKNIFRAEDDISHKLKEDEIIIEFDEEEKTFKFEHLFDLKLAYDITIHKSQGSEFKVVILPLDLIQSGMLNLNLLYTAITRTKSKLVIIGNKQAFYKALKTLERDRNTNLINFLIK